MAVAQKIREDMPISNSSSLVYSKLGNIIDLEPIIDRTVDLSVFDKFDNRFTYIPEDDEYIWNPEYLNNLRQYVLDGGESYESFTVNSFPVLRSLEPYGTHRPPRQGRCWLFDGVDDYGDAGTGIGNALGSTASALTFTSWVNINAISNEGIFYIGSFLGAHGPFAVSTLAALRVHAPGGVILLTYIPTLSTWFHVAVSFNLGLYTLYINGTLHSSTTSGSTLNCTGLKSVVGAYYSDGFCYDGKMRDVRIFNVAKTASEILAIKNGDDDETGLLAQYPGNEESGPTGYDIGPFGNHLTLTNITQSTFHATDTGVTSNRNNSDGYRLSGSVYIPKRLGSDLAADGNALTVTGQSPYPINVEVPCITGDGSTVYCDLGSPLIPATADFELSLWYYHDGSNNQSIFDQREANNEGRFGFVSDIVSTTLAFGLPDVTDLSILNAFATGQWSQVTVTKASNVYTIRSVRSGFDSSSTSPAIATAIDQVNSLIGKLNTVPTYELHGRIADLRITTGGVTTYFPLQDGPGSSNTNRNLSYIKSDGTYGVVSNAIVNGTVSTIWTNRCPVAEDWCVNYGGDIAANGAFVPGQISGDLAADGTAKTLPAGKFGNPYSRVNFNPFTAAELNGVNVEADYPNAPCVTGDGSAVYCDLGSPLIPATADFELSCWYYHATSDMTKRSILSQVTSVGFSLSANENISGEATAGAITFFSGSFPLLGAASGLVEGAWHYITVARVGNLFSFNVSVNGASVVSASNMFAVTIETVNTTVLRYTSEDLRYSNGRIADLRITTGGVTTYFPLTDGSGRDLAYYKSDGTSGIISSAIVGGSEGSIWANKTTNSSPYSRQAIIPRDTKFRGADGGKLITSSPALSGTDLTKLQEYLA